MTLSLRNLFLVFSLIVMTASGCARRDARKINWRMGRGARGDFNAAFTKNPTSQAISSNKCGSYKPANVNWGEVTMSGSQQNFWYEVFYLTWPSLGNLAAEDQLGYVSGSSGQSTGIRFWAHVEFNGTTVNSQRSQVRMEIYDDKACTTGADGTMIPVIPIHIGADQPGFASIGGQVSGSRAVISFSDDIGYLQFDGTNSGGFFTGTVRYSVPGRNGTLGYFRVPSCSFFAC